MLPNKCFQCKIIFEELQPFLAKGNQPTPERNLYETKDNPPSYFRNN